MRRYGLSGCWQLRVAELTGQGGIDMCMLDAFLATDGASHVGSDDVRFTSTGGLVWEGVGGPVLPPEFQMDMETTPRNTWNPEAALEDADIPTKRSYRETAINDFLSSFETRESVPGSRRVQPRMGRYKDNVPSFESQQRCTEARRLR